MNDTDFKLKQLTVAVAAEITKQWVDAAKPSHPEAVAKCFNVVEQAIFDNLKSVVPKTNITVPQLNITPKGGH